MDQDNLLRMIHEAADTQKTTLDLSSYNLNAVPPEIGSLTNLKELILGGFKSANHLSTLPPEIGKLQNLTRLTLGGVQLAELPPEFWQLSNLQFLDLGGNQLVEVPPEIQNLGSLKELYLRGNRINALPPEIGRLVYLEELFLGGFRSGNFLTELPAEIGNLAQLKILELGGNLLTTLPESLWDLCQLETLDLGGNQLVSLSSAIGKLTNLKLLNLSSNRLLQVPPEIGQLASLQQLVLGGFQAGNQLVAIPAEIGDLKNMTQLSLGDNMISDLPEAIWHLENLTHLDLGSNRLSTIPAALGNLTALTHLWLGGNKLTQLPLELGLLTRLTELYLETNRLIELPKSIGGLHNLTYLELESNLLTELPPSLGELTSLIRLNMSNNRITALPTEIGELQGLTWLNMSDNQLTELPESIACLEKLTELDLNGNLLQLSPEILEQKNKPAEIINYYFRHYHEEKNKLVNEAKLIIVGQGEVGKTSLVKRLVDNIFNPAEPSTGGINIRRWPMDISGQEIRLNIWDFGGQEIMHATHQFFLTKRSLYLLVLDARIGEQDSKLEYWVKLIQSFGGDAPIIVVVNKIDEHLLDIDQRGLRAKYPNIVGFAKVSCKKDVGINELKELIKSEASQLEHIATEWRPNEFKIKTHLEETDADYIPYDDYVNICRATGVRDEQQQRELIRDLHDLGIVLNYQDDPRLEDTSILNPEWVTNGVYQIINSDLLAQNNGILEQFMLGEILDQHRYPRDKHIFIIDMMRKFELCFDFEGQRDKRFLIPDLLPKERPLMHWDESTGLTFQFHYDVLPASVISRFIVRLHEYVEVDKSWRSGVVLKDDNNQALVRADFEERKVFISVLGNEATRRSFLGIIRFHFRDIHNSIAKIKAKEVVPLPDNPQFTIDYADLIVLEKRKIWKHFHPKADVVIDVRQLLDGIGNLCVPLSPEQDKRFQLRELMVACFSENELRDLCFQLGQDYDNFPGDTLLDKAREMILAADRQNYLPKLIKVCIELRPREDWSRIE